MPAALHNHLHASRDPRPAGRPVTVLFAMVLGLLGGCATSASPSGGGYGVGAVPGDSLRAMRDRCKQVPPTTGDRQYHATTLAAECSQLRRTSASQPGNTIGGN